MGNIKIPSPNLQIKFSYALEQIRGLYLQEALSETIEKIEIARLDKELSRYATKSSLKALAKNGLRGELLFAVPCLLEKNPFLLGYYRLLLGFSQKEFYSSQCGLSSFKSMEINGILSEVKKKLLPVLCRELASSATALIEGIDSEKLSLELLKDLSLLTVGPQLRGGANVKRGREGINEVFRAIMKIVEHSIIKADQSSIQIENAANRKVIIQLAPDPDLVIREEMSLENHRNVIAIEVKAGTDFSNIHNRLGEAEKSHQKAKRSGFTERWTIVNVDRIDLKLAKKESPSTDRFYRISSLTTGKNDEYEDFKNRVISLTGIKVI